MWQYLCRSVTRGVSDIPSIYAGMQSSTAVLCKGNDVACMPRHPDDVVCMPRHLLTRFDESSDLWYTSSIWPWPGAPKVRIRTVQRFGLRHSPPRMKNHRGSMRKNLNRVKNDLSIEWERCIHVQLVWILTTKRKSLLRVEKNKGLICLLLWLSYYSF